MIYVYMLNQSLIVIVEFMQPGELTQVTNGGLQNIYNLYIINYEMIKKEIIPTGNNLV